jgi:hypothetical protein
MCKKCGKTLIITRLFGNIGLLNLRTTAPKMSEKIFLHFTHVSPDVMKVWGIVFPQMKGVPGFFRPSEVFQEAAPSLPTHQCVITGFIGGFNLKKVEYNP